MAVQAAGMGFGKVLILAGTGFAGSVMLKNGKLSDLIGELQKIVKGLEKSGEKGGSDSDSSDIASQVRRLAMEVRQLASARPITVLNGNSDQGGNVTSLVVPAATLGVIGYGYMRWKGLSFSDLMYVTKHNMANAVSNMTKYLEKVKEDLAEAKNKLMERIKELNGKLDKQKDMTTDIKNQVSDAHSKLIDIGDDLGSLRQLADDLNGKISTIEEKQKFTCAGVMFLCKFVGGNNQNFADLIQDGQRITGRRGFLGPTETRSLQGLQHITEAIESNKFDSYRTEAILQNDIGSNKLCLSRTLSIKS